MSIFVYSKDFFDIYEIGNATSVQMSYYYNDIGKLILDVPINDDNVEALKNDRILYDTDKKLAYIIKNVQTDTTQNLITAHGYTTNHILNSRVIVGPVAITNVETGAYFAVYENLRGLSRVTTEPAKGLVESTNITLYGGNVLDEIMPVLSNAGLGHRMLWNHRTKQHSFEVYKGKDLTAIINAAVFSHEQGTARDLVVNDDVSEFKNVAYVVSNFKEDGTEKQLREIVGEATGDDRHELWVEINLTREEQETEAQFRARMRTHGAMELGKRIRDLSFSATIDPTELGSWYNIGDIVACVSKRFGVRFNARVSGVKYRKDAQTDTAEIILSEPLLTIA